MREMVRRSENAFFEVMSMHRMCALFSSLMAISVWSAEPIAQVREDVAMTEIECAIVSIERSKVHPRRVSSRASSGTTDSSNWSGYIAASSLKQSVPGSVTFAAGHWTVPALSSTPDASYCAIWVGIDGALNGTVEQLGTSHNWVNGAQQNFAWFEMYPNGSFEIQGFPVDVGDTMQAKIDYQGSDTFQLSIANLTKNVSTSIPLSHTKTSAARSSAEWVVEAPYSSSILPLADFQLTTFHDCIATINGVKGTIGNGHWENEVVVMETSDQAVKAQPSALLRNGGSFYVTWKHE